MKFTSTFKTNIVRNVAGLLVFAMLLSCFGCAGKADSVLKTDSGMPVAYPEATDLSAHYCSVENFREISASGLITLLFDENSSSIGVRVNSSENSKLWSALPQQSEDESLSDEAEIVSLEVIHNGSRYFLNSQDSSVAGSTMFWGNTADGFSVVYFITDNPSNIVNVGAGASDEAYSAAAGENILYKISVLYTLRDGCLYADLSWENLGNQDDVLVNIGFLEYFGAEKVAQDGDFLFVPDGSGALINTASSEDIEPVNIAVYGNDIGGNYQLSAIAPVYGIKSGRDAFAAIIEQGDAVAVINANKANAQNNYNRVGASFNITPCQTEENEEFYSKNVYSGNISVCFRFLSGANATYAGLAAACREQFVRNFTLSTSNVSEGDTIPVLVNVIGKAKKDGIFSFNKTLTSFAQAQDILNRIKSKGINNVYLRYSGALSGGLNCENALNADILSSLGGKKGLRELNDYASGLNFNVFVDVSLLSGAESDSSTVANMIDGKSAVSKATVFTQTGFVAEPEKTYLSELTGLEKTILSVLEKFTEYDSTGFCVTDAGEYLFTDFNNSIDRQTASKIINEQLSPLATQNIVMVSKGNFYSLKNADVICNIPMTCARTQSEAYTAVPFVQLILHGVVEFSGDALNIGSDSKSAFLKCIEYGAVPSFALTNSSLTDSEEYNKLFSTDNWLTFMYSCYEQSSRIFNDLRDSRITDHYQVIPGVYCTEYESTTKIYVNYTDSPVTVSGITVEPMSFFRVN